MQLRSGFATVAFPALVDGAARLCVVAVKDFVVDPASRRCEPTDDEPSLLPVDEPFDGDGAATASIRRPADVVPPKPAIDVILVGTARPPGGGEAPSWTVTARIGAWSKQLHILGPRGVHFVPPPKKGKAPAPPRFDDPAPVSAVPLRYEFAFGGAARFVPPDPEAWARAAEAAGLEEPPDAPLLPYPLNPVGRGLVVSAAAEAYEGVSLPQIEDPARPLRPEDLPIDLARLADGPPPAGLGAIATSWAPRAGRWGMTPAEQGAVREQLDRMLIDLDPDDPAQRAAILRLADHDLPDADPRARCAAPDDQQLERLRGDERVEVEGAGEGGAFECVLPGRVPWLTLDRGRGPEEVAVRLDTLWIDLDDDRLRLTWRGSLPLTDLDEVADYPGIKIDVLDLDAEGAREHGAALAAARGDGPPIQPEDDKHWRDELATTKAERRRNEDAWRDTEDQVTSPLLLDAEALRTQQPDDAARREAERAALRDQVGALKARADAAEAAAQAAASKKRKGAKAVKGSKRKKGP